MQTQRRLVRTADGRDIDVLIAGPEDGRPLVVHGGTPAGLVLNARLGNAAIERGLRPVLAARPGYERSTPRPGRRVADVAADVTAVLDELGAREFVSIGFSGGGPHSLACAAWLPERCLAAASVAGVAPFDAAGLDFTGGMGPENVEEFQLAARGAAALTPFLEKERVALGQVTGAQVTAAFGGLVSGADAAALAGEFADDLAASLRAAVREGIDGWLEDDLAFLAHWGFHLRDVGDRAAIWQGDQDNMVPFAHGQWLAAHTPGARVHLEPGAGHLTMTAMAIDRILDDLLDLAERR